MLPPRHPRRKFCSSLSAPAVGVGTSNFQYLPFGSLLTGHFWEQSLKHSPFNYYGNRARQVSLGVSVLIPLAIFVKMSHQVSDQSRIELYTRPHASPVDPQLRSELLEQSTANPSPEGKRAKYLLWPLRAGKEMRQASHTKVRGPSMGSTALWSLCSSSGATFEGNRCVLEVSTFRLACVECSTV